MTAVSPADALTAQLAALPPGALALALSGGLDSTALLHALAHDAGARARGLRAVHVDHGLHADSASWACRCAEACARLDVPLQLSRVSVPPGPGLEANARDARYAAISSQLLPGEIVLTAHHADDQAETMLLRLLRGAAPGGLAAMRPLRPLPPGWLARPWLAVSRAAIRDYAVRHALTWVDDPSNADERLLRNFVRHRLLRPLRDRLPEATTALGRSALLLAGADDEIARAADAAIADAADFSGATLALTTLRELSPFLRGAVLRRWCEQAGVTLPDAIALREIDATLLHARADSAAQVRWRGVALHAWRDRLWLHPPADPPATFDGADWDTRAPLVLPRGWGTLRIDGDVPALALSVRPRAGGERVAVHPRRPRQAVRTSLQSLGVPPWQRSIAPYVWRDGTLCAVGDWLVDHAFADLLRAHDARFVWQRDAPPSAAIP